MFETPGALVAGAETEVGNAQLEDEEYMTGASRILHNTLLHLWWFVFIRPSTIPLAPNQPRFATRLDGSEPQGKVAA